MFTFCMAKYYVSARADEMALSCYYCGPKLHDYINTKNAIYFSLSLYLWTKSGNFTEII